MGYLPRLLCLCFASFFLIHLALGATVLRIYGSAIRRTASLRPRQAAWILFLLRLLPSIASMGIVLFLCVPSYLRYEQNRSTEPIGLLCEVFASLGLTLWLLSCIRAVRALVQTWSFSRSCRTPVQLAGPDSLLKDQAFLIEDRLDYGPAMALVGIYRPKLLLSHQVLDTLTPEQLEAALSHESAHRRSCDNLKWLLLALTPDLFPFVRSLRHLDGYLAQAIELAADDDAIAGREDRSVALAEAILQVARLHCHGVAVPLASPLTTADRDLAFRVERLLAPVRTRSSFPSLSLIGTIGLAALLSLPALCGALHPLHEALERLMH